MPARHDKLSRQQNTARLFYCRSAYTKGNGLIMNRRNLTLLLIILVSLVSKKSWSQGTTATLHGSVHDGTGSAIRGATVVAKNTEKGTESSAKTNDSGEYVLPQLPAQTYSVTFTADGFQPRTFTGFVLQVDQEARLDAVLPVGDVSQQVTVTAAAPLIQSEDSSNGAVIDEQKIKDLPLNGRNFWQLAQLNPNVSNPVTGSSLSARGGFNIAGNREEVNNYLLDGVDDNDWTTGQPTVRPSVDAIREFRILTGVYEAEYGQKAGGQVILTTKSGSNSFHGTLFEFYAAPKLAAENYFNSGNPPTRNQFGASLGGPIRKDRTFFFAAYEGTRSKSLQPGLEQIPYAQESTPDADGFYELYSAKAITQPGTSTPFAQNAAGAYLIPSSSVATQSAYLLTGGFWPALTKASTAPVSVTNSVPNISNADQGTIRADQVITAKNTLGVAYTVYSGYDAGAALTGSSPYLPGYGVNQPQLYQHVSITDDHAFSPHWYNEARLGFNRMAADYINQDYALGDQVAKLGLPQGGPYDFQSSARGNTGLPGIAITGYTSIGVGGDPQWRGDNAINASDATTWVHGNHTTKFGATYLDFFKHSFYVTTGRGSFSFTGQYSGNAFADFLLGDIASLSYGNGNLDQYPKQKGAAVYGEDEWKVRPSLTINYGLRYELFGPQKEKNNKIDYFDAAKETLNTGNGEAYSVDPATGHLVQVGTVPVRHSNAATPLLNFAPRLGFAYRPGSSTETVIRGGYGIYYSQNIVSNGSLFSAFGLGSPFVITEAYSGTTWANPIPTGIKAGAISMSIVPHDLPTPYNQEWSLGIQHEFHHKTLIEATYQGSKGTHFFLPYNINQPIPGAGSIQTRRPYNQWSSITNYAGVSSSSYNSLILRAEQRFTGGLTFLSSFVYSKSLDLGGTNGDSQPQNPSNLQAEWGPSLFDQKFRVITNGIYDLPFGRGKAWLGDSPLPVRALVSGWRATGILTLQSGRPFSPTTTDGLASNTGATDRAFQIGDSSISHKSVNEWFNTSAYRVNDAANGNNLSNTKAAGYVFGYGNAGRNSLRGPGIQNFDAGLSRDITLHEGQILQLRAEAFNAFNHPNFANPGSNASSGTFGVITSTSTANRQIQFAAKIIF
jgi:hypothetical protein